MTEIYEGFDSRYWDGVLTPANAARFKFACIKASQGKSWNPADRTTLQLQWRRAKDVYNLARLPFHYWEAPWPWEDPVDNGRKQAENFYKTMIDKNGGDMGELPPCIDCEHKFVGMAGGDARALSFQKCLIKTENLWGKVPMIYSAKWYWDIYMHPYFVKIEPEYWLKYELWEADPPPDTPIAGWGDTCSVRQVQLDILIPGFYGMDGKACGVDINETTKAWYDSKVGNTTPPTPPDCQQLVDAAVAACKAECKVVVDQKNAEIVGLNAIITAQEAEINSLDKAVKDIREICDSVSE